MIDGGQENEGNSAVSYRNGSGVDAGNAVFIGGTAYPFGIDNDGYRGVKMLRTKILKNLQLNPLRAKNAAFLLLVFWQMLNCSAYTHSGNPTASGVMPAVGHCAADHLPFNSKVILPNGTVLTVTDRFGGNYTNRLDVFMDTEQACWNFGRRWLNCKVITPK